MPNPKVLKWSFLLLLTILSSLFQIAPIYSQVTSANHLQIDKIEFAPGYPNYTIQAIDQLKAFPDPRYAKNIVMKRNFPWADITYLYRQIPEAGGKVFGKPDPANAVALVNEMASRWNYYVEIPCLRQDSLAANRNYSNPASVYNALILYARNHPELPTASVIMQAQGKPIHAGFNRGSNFEGAQNLSDNYYLRDVQGNVVMTGKRKWLSPLASLDIIKKDAATTAFYLRQLSRHLGRPVDMLNENGEIFGHMKPDSLLKKDPAVKKDIESRGLTNPQYNGLFQNRLDTCYKNEILRSLGWEKTAFTFYNVSAYNSKYWPDYAMRRTSNLIINGNHYSTPSFYPSTPDNWIDARGSLNGYGRVAEGRVREIALSDKLFAPFVSAGWKIEENNIHSSAWHTIILSEEEVRSLFSKDNNFAIRVVKGTVDIDWLKFSIKQK